MQKRDIPKPKYGLGDSVIYNMAGEGNYAPRRNVGTIEKIDISCSLQHGNTVRYWFFGMTEESYDEASITRRVLQAGPRS